MKLETFQPTGSFKVRGGLAAVTAAHDRQAGRRLVAASAGNHALGIAFAADRIGAEATVVVSENASAAKVSALEHFDVELVRHGSGYDEAEALALRLAEEKGGRFVSPYNDADVIAGQASCAEELLDEIPGLRTIVVPVGGGGLVSGICLATEGTGIRIVGVEPAQAPAMTAVLAAGHGSPITVGATIADGLAGNIEDGSVTIDICRRRGIEMLAVTEDQIRAAICFLAVEHGVVAEGAGAVAVAALHSGLFAADSRPTAVIVTGRNIEPSLLGSILAE